MDCISLSLSEYPMNMTGFSLKIVSNFADRYGVCLEKIGYNHRSVAYVDMAIDATAYHEFEVSCIGNTISVSFDGKHLFSFTDPYVISRGSIGLYSCESDAYYKNLEVLPN